MGPQRALLLAEEFEDFDALVNLSAQSGDLTGLDHHLANSVAFRASALEIFLRSQKLQPLFFRTIQRFPLSPVELEEVLAPHPEIRWTLDLHNLGENPAENEWQAAFERIERRASAVVNKEKNSAVKRDAFAALAALARAAAGQPPEMDGPVRELACLGRLRKVCFRFGPEAMGSMVGTKRPRQDEPPASPEECLIGLAGCIRTAIGELRKERCEGTVLEDAAMLVLIVERGMSKRGVDVGQLVATVASSGIFDDGAVWVATAPGGDERAARCLQRLWAEVALADDSLWQDILQAPAG